MIRRIGVEELDRKSEIIRELINGEKATVLNHHDLLRPSWTLEFIVPKKWLIILDVPEGKMDDVELYLTENTFEVRKPYHADSEVVDLPPHIILAARKPCRLSDNEMKSLTEKEKPWNRGEIVDKFRLFLTYAVLMLIICAIITYFLRMYFPDNFHPETVSFFENYWVLILALCFIVGLPYLIFVYLMNREL